MTQTLASALKDRILTTGPLRFDEFMRLALYHEPGGYYTRHFPGADSDYRTAPSISPWYGRLAARHLEEVWKAIGCPEAFSVIEAGAGGGDLAAAALASAAGDFARSLNWVLVEPIARIAGLQKDRLAGYGDQLTWASGLSDLSPRPGVVLANEVLDNFPVRLIELGDQGPREVMVGWESGFREVLNPVDGALDDSGMRALELLEPGDRFEIITGLDGWCRSAAEALQTGALVVIDYGDLEPDIFRLRPMGSLVTYRDGNLGVDPLLRVGEADITAHVNFSELHRAAQRAGLTPDKTVTQREWLQAAGIEKVVADLREAEVIARFEGRHGDWVGLMAQRSRVEMLASRGGLGDYLVFTATKGI